MHAFAPTRIAAMREPRVAALVWSVGRPNHALENQPRGHDPRQIDLIAIVALLIVIVPPAGSTAKQSDAPSNTAFIVPSQSVRW